MSADLERAAERLKLPAEQRDALRYLPPDDQRRFVALIEEEARVRSGAMDEPLSLRDFVDRVTGGRFKWYRYALVLCTVLQRVADGILKRVIILAPPRHGKSELVSRLFPAYYLYRHPTRWVGHCSYAYELSATMSRSARANYRAFYGERDESDNGTAGHAQAVKQWETGAGGGMWASGIGGGQLGKGWHLGIIDDPVKNAQEAQSETIAHRNKEWYQSTFYTRQEPDAALVLVMQRWPGASDFAGYLLDEEYAAAGDVTEAASPDDEASADARAADDEAAERWHIVNFDALRASPNDLTNWVSREGKPLFPSTCTVEPDWRQPGEALCPERYPAEKLRRFRKRIGTYYFSALFQQRPRARADSMLEPDWFIPVDRVPDVPGIIRVRAWDFAGTPALPDGGHNPAGAYTVGVLLARVPVTPGIAGHLSDEDGETSRFRFYFEDLVRGQWSPRERDKRIKQTADADRGRYGRVEHYGEQEPADAGQVQADAFRTLLAGHIVSTDRATGDKVVRAEPMRAAAEGGNIYMVRGPWNAVARREIGEFPHQELKDVVDALSAGYNKLAKVRPRRRTQGTMSQRQIR